MSTFPDGLFQYGGQPVGAMFASPWSTVRFVDGEDGNDGFDGLKPTQSFKTIQAAVTASTRGDVIYVRPQQYTVGTGFSRYSEDVSVGVGGGGTASHCTNADISIVGVTNSRNPEFGPRWTFATTQALLVDAPALHVENIGFFTEAATYGALLRNNGATNTRRGSDGTTFYNCVFKGQGIYVLSGGTGLTIDNCRFTATYSGAVSQINFSCSANPGRQLRIRRCEWTDANGAASNGPSIVIAGSSSENVISDCRFGVLPTGNAWISATGTNTGLISNCYFASADMTLSTGIVKGGLFASGLWDESMAAPAG